MKKPTTEHEKRAYQERLTIKLARKERLTSDPSPVELGRAKARALMESKEDKVHAGVEHQNGDPSIRSQGWRSNSDGQNHEG